MTPEDLLVFALCVLSLGGIAYSLGAFNVRCTSHVHRQLRCNILERDAEVDIMVREGKVVGVVHCSLLGNFDTLTCRQRCLATPIRQLSS